MARRRGRLLLGVAGFAAAAAVVAGCGGGERTFSASEFVDQVNQQGVSVRLGRQLESGGGADELYAIKLPPLPGAPAPPPDDEGGPGVSASLYVYDDTDAAEDQLRACRASAGLLCLQAANVVVVFEEGGIEAQRLGLAIRRLAE